MNIYALKGFRVRAMRNSSLIEKHLKIGEVYTVEFTEVHFYDSQVYLQEVPNIPFNPSKFDDVSKQSRKRDKEHPDWAIYH